MLNLNHINKEKDYESGLGDFGVRKYDDGIGRFTSIDPLFEKYAGWTPYHYSLNNPVNMKDDNGKLVIFASGACTNEGISYMCSELSFQIKSDATTGKLSVPGIVNPQNPAEQVILDAISDPNVTLNVDFTSENTMNDINGNLQQVLGGMYGGSKINADGSVNALQGINIEHFKVGDESTGGDRVGQNVIHEVVEGYIGAVTKPGTTYKDSYLQSHSTALSIYPLFGNNEATHKRGIGQYMFYYNGSYLYSLPNSTIKELKNNEDK